MSTLKTNTIQHLTSGFNNVVQFTDGAGTQNGTLCRAWVKFNGTSTVAINGNFNVTSITDNGTGDYTLNFSNSLSDTNYSGGGNVNDGVIKLSTFNTGSLRILTQFLNGSQADMNPVCVSIFR